VLAKTFGCCRFVYNRILANIIAHYDSTKESLRKAPAQYKTEFEWLREVNSLALSNEQLHFEAVFRSSKISIKGTTVIRQTLFAGT
jgi:putative transposase